MSNYRSNIRPGGEPVQTSMIRQMQDYGNLTAVSLELGIILSVYPSDSIYNRTAQSSTVRRGWRHECTVQVVSSGHGGDYKLTNVVIPPNSPSGIDNYEEQLPRGCSQTFKEGGQFDPNMQLSSPYDLDGDWCVVGFLKRDYDQPFILRWWPNPNNDHDPQTEGMGNPDSSGTGKALNQVGRYFRRTNGVEHIVTKEGNVYFDTTLAGEKVLIHDPTKNGRFAREASETGGNVRTVLKPSAKVEVDFNTPANGVGYLDNPDVQIPQVNPATPNSSSSERTNTYLKFDKDVLHLKCPDFISLKSSSVELEGSDTAFLVAPSVTVGKDGTDTVITGNSLKVENTTTDVESTTVTIKAPSVTIGNGGELPLITSAAATQIAAALATLQTALAAPVVDFGTANTAVEALGAFCSTVSSALTAGQTIATKAG